MQLGGCQNNNIYSNILANNDLGIESYYSPNNNIYSNEITNCHCGIALRGSNQNSIYENNIADCGTGISISSASSNTTVYHNNFINDKTPAYERHETALSPLQYAYSSGNKWDDGYPSGGNYWSNYNGTDANGDGIGDSSYVVYENYADHYPLMNPFKPSETPSPSPTLAPPPITHPTTLQRLPLPLLPRRLHP